MLGEVGDGWQVAMTTLLHERGTLGFALSATLDVAVRKLVALGEGARRHRSDPARPDRARVDRAAGAQVHELPLADDAAEDRHPGPRGLGVEARLVGGEPAADEARARDPRLARAADRRRRLRRRLLAVPAAPLARQHDRGRHERDPPQHRRRARARHAEDALDGLLLHARAGRPAARGARVPRGEPVADDGAARGARLGRDPAERRVHLPRRGGALRGARPRRSTTGRSS